MVAQQLGKKTVLIVEDERSLATAIMKKLQLSGFETALAASVEEAKQHLAKLDIDAVWLDHYLMGEEDGLDLLKALKANGSWRRIPVFAVSNTASDDKIRTYLELGISSYYVKSNHRLDEIIDAIRSGFDEEY